MTVEIGLLLAMVAGVVGAATFFLGRLTAAKNTGCEWGEMKSDIKHIKERVDDITDSSSAALEKEAGERKKADERLHARLDEHISTFHSS